jgi:hypothetical protein
LLQSWRILIVSEAGAGKTHECRARCDILWDAGEAAFYFDLAALVSTPVREMLSAQEEKRFDAWLKAQSDVATIFLDSIDELKLSLGSFELALKRFEKSLSGQLGRARIVITTRPIPIDRQLIERHLPLPEFYDAQAMPDSFADVATGSERAKSRTDDKPKAWRNVALTPLSDEQIREMAILQGVADPDQLLADIQRRNAQEFARRPQDLIELCSDWREHGGVRRHSDQVRSNVTIKLKPRTDRAERCELSDERAMEGARRLALAAMLTRKLTLRHNVETDTREETEAALDASLILPDWTPEERGTLLERSLFGFATYGRVRFHHRSVVEYLAARQLATLRERGAPSSGIRRLLFTDTVQGERVVRPSMSAVAGWLAIDYDDIFTEVRSREPAVLLQHGDAESLSSEKRAQALRAYAERYGTGGWRGLSVPQVQIDRFASADLGPVINCIWDKGIENPEVRELLLELVGAGRIIECADIPYDLVISSSTGYRERITALETLIALRDERLRDIATSVETKPSKWPDELARPALVRLFPNYISISSVCRILARVHESKRTIGDIAWRLPRVIMTEAVSVGTLNRLRYGLTLLLAFGAEWSNEWPHFRSTRSFLADSLAAVCLRLIRDQIITLEVMRSSAIALRLRGQEYEDEDGAAKQLRSTIAKLPADARQKAFWAEDHFLQTVHPRWHPWHRVYELTHRGVISLDPQADGAWIRNHLADKSRSLETRAMMLYAEINVIARGPDWLTRVDNLKQLVSDSPALLEIINQKLTPPPNNPELKKLEARAERRQRKTERDDAKAHASWMTFWREVAAHPEDMFASDRSENTVWNLWRAMERSGQESRASGWNRRFIEHYFDKPTADRLRHALMPIWRNNRPTLRSERPETEKDTYLVLWQLGLAAIGAEAENPHWAEKLSLNEAALAARYAPIELNGFPSWLQSLIAAHPEAVDLSLGQELTATLREPLIRGNHSMFLQNIVHASDAIATFFAPRIRAWLDETWRTGGNCDEDSAAAERRLTYALEIVLKENEARARGFVRELALINLGEDQRTCTGVWLSALMRIDPSAATEWLEGALAYHQAAHLGSGVKWFAELFGDRHSGHMLDPSGDHFTPALLLRLVRLAYQHVRPIDDIHHEGSYTPDTRDYAERGRDALVSALLGKSGAEAFAAKISMANEPMFSHFKDHAIAVARERAAEDADGIALTEAEVVALNRYGEAPPTSRDALFALMRDRLLDIDDLLLTDTSPRQVWATITEETEMRKMIAREFSVHANQAYTVDQEAVTADEKETDIRLRATASDDQAIIELKIGDKPRSGAELRDTLKRQLVIKYMAASSCRSGCLLITLAQTKRWQHPDTHALLDFPGLIAMLNDEARKITLEMGGNIRLMAKGIDLRPRLSSEKTT